MQRHDVSPRELASGMLVQHRVRGFSERWLIWEEKVAESAWHAEAWQLIQALLAHWVTSTGRDAVVFHDMAVRVMQEKPRVGFSPDVILVEPAPPGARDLSSVRLWETEHATPALAIEVVSPGHPYKDYGEIPDQCAAAGVRELVIFDPKMVGPKRHGGPYRIQVWRRTGTGVFTQVDAGEGPYFSEVIGAYLFAEDEGRLLRIASDAACNERWITSEEAARAESEAARVESEAARVERDALLARVAELEAQLTERGPGR